MQFLWKKKEISLRVAVAAVTLKKKSMKVFIVFLKTARLAQLVGCPGQRRSS